MTPISCLVAGLQALEIANAKSTCSISSIFKSIRALTNGSFVGIALRIDPVDGIPPVNAEIEGSGCHSNDIIAIESQSGRVEVSRVTTLEV
jgi:hypothetical protein